MKSTGAPLPRVLIVATRFPLPPYTGDRMRTLAWLEALAGRAATTLVAPPGNAALLPAGVRFVPAPLNLVAALRDAAGTLVRGLPLHTMLAAGRFWKTAIARARSEAGGFATEVLVLQRGEPWIAPFLRAPRRLLDAVDSLAGSLAERAAAARGPVRLFWRREARRTAAMEARSQETWDTVLAVTPAEAEAFPGGALVAPLGVRVGPLPEGPRDLDVAFWGRLPYFANNDAARFLLDEIWPRVRAARPGARLAVGGAGAPRWLRRRSGHDGVEVVSPIADREALLARVKVAILPLRYGTGQSTKVLEAAVAGCALVATPKALAAYPDLAGASRCGTDATGLAAAVVELLGDDAGRQRLAAALHSRAASGWSAAPALARLADAALGPA